MAASLMICDATAQEAVSMPHWKDAFISGRMLRPLVSALLIFFVTLKAVHAGQISAPAGAAELLLVDAGGRHHILSESAFLALPRKTVVTHTAWTEGPQVFEGVLMRDILATAEVDIAALAGRSVEALALNDYAVLIPFDDIRSYDIVIARVMSGEPLTRRDKGPYWIVYPRDRHPELADSRYDHRWVWQLRQLKVQ